MSKIATRLGVPEEEVVNMNRRLAAPDSSLNAPVKTEGCVICHTPHGSTNPRLLKRSQVNLLCLECHTFTLDTGAPALSLTGQPPAFTNSNGTVEGTLRDPLSGVSSLTAAVDEAIAARPDVAAKVRDGKVAAAGVLVGAVMKATRGKADAARVHDLILQRLS